MAAPKRTKQQRQIDLQKEIELYAQGWTQQQIADEMGLSQPVIKRDLDEVAQLALSNATQAIGMVKARQLANLTLTVKEMWDEYERSKDETTITTNTVQQSSAGKYPGTTHRAINRTERRFGDPRYIMTMLKAEDQIAKLMGLYAPTKTELAGINGGQAEDVDARRERVKAIIARLIKRRIADIEAGKNIVD